VVSEAVVDEREATHGDFKHTAELSQSLKMVMHSAINWPTMAATQKDAIEMMLVKLARIGSGDATCADHWIDIAGYANLGGE